MTISNAEKIRQVFHERVHLEQSAHNQISEIIASESSFGEQIDAIADVRNWFRPKEATRKVIDSYMSGVLSVNEAVAQLAGRVEEVYYKQIREEGRYQTPLHELWNLWNGMIHAAKKIHWENEDSHNDQEKLLGLVRMLKLRTDVIPTRYKHPPKSRYVSLEDRSILWSRTNGFGLAIAEADNDMPGRNHGYAHVEIEVQAALNYCAFLARLTITGLRDCLNKGRVWMVCATDGQMCKHHGGVDEQQNNILFRIASVWLRLAGPKMWEACCQGSRWVTEEKEVDVSANPKSKRLPWYGKQSYSKAAEETWEDMYLVRNAVQWSRARWCYWKRRLLLVTKSTNRRWSDGSKEAAQEMVSLMEEIERSSLQLSLVWKASELRIY